MEYLHYEVSAGPNDIIQVSLDAQANVLLMDSPNFSSFHSGRSYNYHGGLAKRSPVNLVPPHHGRWHVVINLGGYAGNIRASVRVL
jgi:hypothetical protein